MKYALIVTFLFLAIGCGSSLVTLQHPTTKIITECDYSSSLDQQRCLDDYQRQGYERIPSPTSKH